jgi:hypothetical protein
MGTLIHGRGAGEEWPAGDGAPATGATKNGGGGGGLGSGGGWRKESVGGNEVTPHPTALRRKKPSLTQRPALAGVGTGYSRPTGYFRTKSGNSRPRLPETGKLEYELLDMQERDALALDK